MGHVRVLGSDAGRLVACVPAVCIWMVAALYSASWLLAMASQRIQFGSAIGASLLPVLWLVTLCVGLPLVGYLAYRTARGRTSLIWQPALVALGLAALLVSLGD